jgi:6-phosphogluconolactonase
VNPAPRHRPGLIVGTYTEDLPHVRGTAGGVLGASYDPRAGIVGPVAVLARTRNPSFAVPSATGRQVYVVNETTSFDGRPGGVYEGGVCEGGVCEGGVYEGGGITAFARDPETGALRELNSRPSGGAAPCHLAIYPGGRFLLVANYESGSVVPVALEPDGRLGQEHARVQHAGSSVQPRRQAGPHAHMVAGDPVTGDVLVADLGLDAVLTYRLTESGLAERPGTRIDAPPGTGPRHLAFHPDGRHLFVVGELNSTVLTLRRVGGRFVLAGVTSTLGRASEAGDSLAAAIRVAASGRHVFVSNRGDDSIAMLRFDPGAVPAADAAPGPPALTLVHLQPAGGRGPRDFCLTPDGGHLVVANTGSHNLVVLRIDEDRPELAPVSATEAPSPSSVAFAP